MQDKEYIAILQQSLEKKNRILDLIVEKNKEQRILFTDETLPPERLEENIKEKGDLVDQLNQLDDGFEQVYNRVREILNKEKEAYRDEIKKMQELIREITDKSATIQAQEQRNKELAAQKFASVKKEIRKARTSTKAASQYYKSMAKTNVVDSQFLDKKK
ncbi:flagellar export chaperone FlgN [Roseburia sp. 499]|uniref:flagellar export chaperone FlgN n=1 Tax=Roseburia sp. 499 TaxID=1261634 RepID=UPI0009526401|nr:flagellar export chaperone FlgN [Roseburia sp. 499]WVK70015.1 flagellar protein FliT [Roseburia sp. 499]